MLYSRNLLGEKKRKIFSMVSRTLKSTHNKVYKPRKHRKVMLIFMARQNSMHKMLGYSPILPRPRRRAKRRMKVHSTNLYHVVRKGKTIIFKPYNHVVPIEKTKNYHRAIDAKRPALKYGKRASKRGKVYYEYRRNRADYRKRYPYI